MFSLTLRPTPEAKLPNAAWPTCGHVRVKSMRGMRGMRVMRRAYRVPSLLVLAPFSPFSPLAPIRIADHIDPAFQNPEGGP
jgi:hypothetical protein